jgi:hypothetical protein
VIWYLLVGTFVIVLSNYINIIRRVIELIVL